MGPKEYYTVRSTTVSAPGGGLELDVFCRRDEVIPTRATRTQTARSWFQWTWLRIRTPIATVCPSCRNSKQAEGFISIHRRRICLGLIKLDITMPERTRLKFTLY